MRNKSSFISMSLVFGVLASQSVLAQSTLVNVPSTDVVAEKKLYLEFDFVTDYAWKRQGSTRTYVLRAVVGVARNLEAGVNVGYTDGAVPQPVEVQPNFKWRFYTNEGKRESRRRWAASYIFR